MSWLLAGGLLILGLLGYVTSALYVVPFSPLAARADQSAPATATPVAAVAEPPVPSAARPDRWDGAAPTIRLWAGAPPDGWPVDVPVPPDARVADGGPPAGGDGPRDRAVLSTAGGVPEVLAFYRAELLTRGWQEVRSWMSRPGGGTVAVGGAVSAFCLAPDAPALLVAVVTTAPGESELRLLVDTDRPGACASSPSGTPDPTDPWNGQPPPTF